MPVTQNVTVAPSRQNTWFTMLVLMPATYGTGICSTPGSADQNHSTRSNPSTLQEAHTFWAPPQVHDS